MSRSFFGRRRGVSHYVERMGAWRAILRPVHGRTATDQAALTAPPARPSSTPCAAYPQAVAAGASSRRAFVITGYLRHYDTRSIPCPGENGTAPRPPLALPKGLLRRLPRERTGSRIAVPTNRTVSSGPSRLFLGICIQQRAVRADLELGLPRLQELVVNLRDS